MSKTAVTSASCASQEAQTGLTSAPDSLAARAVVGVVPPLERRRRARLFDALEAAYPIRFEARDPESLRGIDGLVVFGALGPATTVEAHGVPRLVYTGAENPGEALGVELGQHAALARALHGARLSERHAAGFTAIAPRPEENVLGRVSGSPAWVLSVDGGVPSHRVAVGPDELGPREVLRNRLAPGRCLALLALVQFIRDLTAGRRWEVPAPRAAIVIDDPNLRWPTYGHIDYAALSRSAALHGYHVAIAMIPLDGWPAHPRAVRLFSEGRTHLSLCIHGNDHDGPELARPRSLPEAIGPVVQAMRRSRAFERRTGVVVDPVMVAPHEQVSEPTMAALRACGYEAISGARPYGWIRFSPDLPWLTRPANADPLIGWGSAELMPGGFPLLLRMDFEHPREELVIRAFLGQPVILYGHHDLLEAGTDRLEAVAAEVQRLGDVRWSSLSGIARGASETRRAGDRLELRMLGRRVRVEVPAAVAQLSIDTTALAPGLNAQLTVRAGGIERMFSPALEEAHVDVDHPGVVEVDLDDGGIDLASVHPGRRRFGPLVRRLAAEGRDRSAHRWVSRGR
jgi:hypothetical protein